MKKEYLKNIINEEFISVLREMAVECPCDEECENTSQTGFIVNGKFIQLNSIVNGILKPHINNQTDKPSNCGCCGEAPNQTPQMPANQVTQFGNTTPFPAVQQGGVNRDDSGVVEIPGYFSDKVKQLIKILMKKPAEKGIFNGNNIILNRIMPKGKGYVVYIKKEGLIKEIKFKNK
jgi:hypothetical protein